MTFEEQFPSLKGKSQKHTNCTVHYSDGLTDYMPESEVFYKDQLQEHCLDKQRVIDTIKRLTYNCDKDKGIEWELDGQIDAEELLKELGLIKE